MRGPIYQALTRLSQLKDILFSSLADQDQLKFDSASGKWVNFTPDPPYTDEDAQDAVGSILTDTTTINFNYNDVANQITANVQNLTSTDIGDFTEASQDAIGVALTDSVSISFEYDDVANTITASIIGEAIDDRVAALLVAGTNITLTYDDVANTLTIASSDPAEAELYSFFMG